MGDGPGAGHLVWSRSGGPAEVEERGRFEQPCWSMLADLGTVIEEACGNFLVSPASATNGAWGISLGQGSMLQLPQGDMGQNRPSI